MIKGIVDSHYSNLLIVREGDNEILVPNGTFLIYGRVGKSTTFCHLLIDERQRTKSDLDIKYAFFNIMRNKEKTNNFLDTGK